MTTYTIPDGYEEVEEIAVGDYVFNVFGIDECYHSGPYEVAKISGPYTGPDDYIASVNPHWKALTGQEMRSITLAVCDDSPEWMKRQKQDQGWVNGLHKVGGIVKTPGGRILVKRRHKAVETQKLLF